MDAGRVPLGLAGKAVLWLGLCALASPGGQGEELRAILRRRGPGDARTPAEVATGLAALGSDAVPALYDLATGQGLDALVGEEWQPAAWCCTPEEIPSLCARALEQAPRAAVVEHLTRVLDAEPTLPERLILLRILGARGSAEGLGLVLRSALGPGEVELERPGVRRAVRGALAAILRRDDEVWAKVAKELDGLAPAIGEVLAEAIGESRQYRGMAVLERLFQTPGVSKMRVAEAMAELERSRPWDLGGRTLEHCSLWLRGLDAAQCALAARLAGSLHALESVPALIDLVEAPDPLVRRCAYEALQAMAVRPLDPDPALLDAWYQREEAWREARWTHLFEELVSTEPGPANEALRELAQHPLYRHEAARALAESLPEQPPSVALASCVELASLRSLCAMPGLVAVLERKSLSPQLRAASWHTLRSLTGEGAELSPALWRALLDP